MECPSPCLLSKVGLTLYCNGTQEVNALSRGFWGDLDRDFMAGSSSPTFGPGLGATDVKETDSAYELHVDVPSLTKEDVKVNPWFNFLNNGFNLSVVPRDTIMPELVLFADVFSVQSKTDK